MEKIPNNITREHLLSAIERIDQEGIPSGANSQYYDLLFNEKRYPPKLVMSWANEYANGKMLDRTSFAGGKDTLCFKLLEREGFTIGTKPPKSKNDQTEIDASFASSEDTFVSVEKEPKVWFVCQGTTYNDEGKKSLWAPKKDKRGIGKYYWDNMNDVKKGDFIFHYSDGLRGVSEARSDAYSASNPMEKSPWRDEGTRVNITNLFEFEQPIHYSRLKAKKGSFEKHYSV